MEPHCGFANPHPLREAGFRPASRTLGRCSGQSCPRLLVDSPHALPIYSGTAFFRRHAALFVLVPPIVNVHGIFPRTKVGGEEYSVGIVEVGNLP
jgi:hypothetical protein